MIFIAYPCSVLILFIFLRLTLSYSHPHTQCNCAECTSILTWSIWWGCRHLTPNDWIERLCSGVVLFLTLVYFHIKHQQRCRHHPSQRTIQRQQHHGITTLDFWTRSSSLVWKWLLNKASARKLSTTWLTDIYLLFTMLYTSIPLLFEWMAVGNNYLREA